MTTNPDVRCSECREALSARLDGEAEAVERSGVDSHLNGCAECRWWAERAATVTRLARTAPVEPYPDLVGAVMASASTQRPARRRPRVRAKVVARVLLACAGLGQLWLAVGAVVVASGHGARGGAELGGANLEHLLQGEVHLSREASHAVALLGLLALIALGRLAGRPGQGSPTAVHPEGAFPGAREPDLEYPAPARRSGPGQGLKPTGEHRAA